jgi:protocatechuate 3,4-dioxygenase beta subunit
MRRFVTIGAIAAAATILAIGYSQSPLASQDRKSAAAPLSRQLQLHHAIEIARTMRVSSQQTPIFKKSAIVDGAQAVAGHVVTSDGTPTHLLKIMVIAFTADSSLAPSKGFAYANPDGSYLIENLLPGEFFVVAQADSYETQYYDQAASFTDAKMVSVTASDTTTGIDFKLVKITPATGAISGRVTDGSGAPIINAYVNAYSRDNPFSYGRAQTARDGTYRLEGLKTGNYFVQVWAESYISEFYDDARTPDQATLVAVNEPNETTSIDFVLGVGGAITGKVTDKAGNPFAGAIVQSHYAGTDSIYKGFGMALTDKDGTYKITGLAAGSYVVSAEVWTQWSYAKQWYKNAGTSDSAAVLDVQEQQVVADIDFALDLPKITGSINGVVLNLQGEPLAEAIVEAYNATSSDSSKPEPRFWGYATTDAFGRYRIDLLPGDYFVMASVYDGWQSVVRWYPGVSTQDSAKTVAVQLDVDLEGIDFTLPIVAGDGVISGRVTADDGRALAGAFIEVMPATSAPDSIWRVWAYSHTDSTGYYAVPKLPAGKYFVRAQYWEDNRFGEQWYLDAASREQATPVPLDEAQRIANIDFTLELRSVYGSIFGRVSADSNSSPIPRAYVEISPLNRDNYRGAPMALWNWNATTNERGEYRLDLLPEGEYLVSVYANGAFEYFENAVVAEQAAPVKVPGGDSVQVNFGLTPRDEGRGIISGTITAELDSVRMPIAIVIARPTVTLLVWPQSEMFFTAVTNPDGSYTMAGLPSGEYYLMSFAPGYIGEYYDNAFDPSQATPVLVDQQKPASGIDIALTPIHYRAEDGRDPRAGMGAAAIGKVSAKNGKGVSEANVYVLNEAAQPLAYARTNSEGSYEIAGVPPGQYRMLASHAAFNSKYNGDANRFNEAVPVDLGLGKSEVDFVLEPKGTTGVDEPSGAAIPKTIELYGNYPNPFNPTTQIAFGLPTAMRVTIRIFNVIGEEVAVLQEGVKNAGVHHLTWNGRNAAGREVGTGLYLYRLESAAITLYGKMLLIR